MLSRIIRRSGEISRTAVALAILALEPNAGGVGRPMVPLVR
jgi:hypothetical protein